MPTINEHAVPVSAAAARVLSTTSIGGTPRSSGEFYSISNNSSETLASEYVTQQQPLRMHGGGGAGGLRNQPHSRRPSNLSPNYSPTIKPPETLMMGYAQVQGSFTLDGSLVNLGPFEQVKRKAVVGGHGGGVIGLETNNTKRDSGLFKGFGSLGWGSFTSSIGELLVGSSGDLSSIKEMRGLASSKAVPLLSTPQSILFVDLSLAPGEEKSYEYAFRLPRGLPPTHRGRAMKISYTLVIGTQRPGGAREQQVKSVEVPFRVLGSVNSHGEILGHDLMSPYIILRDQAQVQSVDYRTKQKQQKKKLLPPSAAGPPATINSFLSYVDELLLGQEHARTGAGGAATGGSGGHGGLLSPTATMPSSRRHSAHSIFDDNNNLNASAKEAIDLAILRANVTQAGQASANRFEIARNGRRVAVVMLTRPAYRLGESVTMAIDFAGAEVPCYAVHCALETAERVDPALALRSEASVHRVTRKVWVSGSEATMYARRVVFNPTIPITATPEFVTSGVSLEWKVRVEFVVPVQGLVDDKVQRPPGQQQQQHQHQREDGTIPEEEDEDLDDERNDQAGGGARDGLEEESRGLVARNNNGGNEERIMANRIGGFGGDINAPPPHHLLEEISRDERGGTVLVAAENLICESFEVAVPLRVYGAVGMGLEKLDRDEALEEGLVV